MYKPGITWCWDGMSDLDDSSEIIEVSVSECTVLLRIHSGASLTFYTMAAVRHTPSHHLVTNLLLGFFTNINTDSSITTIHVDTVNKWLSQVQESSYLGIHNTLSIITTLTNARRLWGPLSWSWISSWCHPWWGTIHMLRLQDTPEKK